MTFNALSDRYILDIPIDAALTIRCSLVMSPDDPSQGAYNVSLLSGSEQIILGLGKMPFPEDHSDAELLMSCQIGDQVGLLMKKVNKEIVESGKRRMQKLCQKKQ